MAMTEQKRRYAEARLSGLRKKDAAIKAGCPEKTASQAATRYEKDPDVKAAMGRSMAVKSSRSKGCAAADPAPFIAAAATDPLAFLADLMNNLEADPKLRLDAAKALASFTVAKPGSDGKKEAKAKAAAEVGKGKFSPKSGPRLVVNNGR